MRYQATVMIITFFGEDNKMAADIANSRQALSAKWHQIDWHCQQMIMAIETTLIRDETVVWRMDAVMPNRTTMATSKPAMAQIDCMVLTTVWRTGRCECSKAKVSADDDYATEQVTWSQLDKRVNVGLGWRRHDNRPVQDLNNDCEHRPLGWSEYGNWTTK